MKIQIITELEVPDAGLFKWVSENNAFAGWFIDFNELLKNDESVACHDEEGITVVRIVAR